MIVVKSPASSFKVGVNYFELSFWVVFSPENSSFELGGNGKTAHYGKKKKTPRIVFF